MPDAVIVLVKTVLLEPYSDYWLNFITFVQVTLFSAAIVRIKRNVLAP